MLILFRITPLFFLTLLVSSCNTQKDLAQKESLSCQGIMHLSENGCPYFIEITQSQIDGLAVGSKIFPVQIKDSFKKKGLKLAFNAVISRAPSPSECSVDAVGALSNISVVP